MNNAPAYYRTSPFAALIDSWRRKAGGQGLVAYQVRRGLDRRQEWFYSDDDAIPYRHHYVAARCLSLPGRRIYPPAFGTRLLHQYNPTHLLVAGWDSPLALACATYAKLRGRRLATWVESNPSTSRRLGRAANRFRRAFLNCADFVLVPTQASAEYVNHLSGEDLPALILPNPVSHARIEDDEAQASDSKRLIFVGELTRRKGFDIFAEAVRAGGPGGWSGVAWGPDTEGLAARAPSNCEVHTGTPFEQIKTQLRTSDVWLIPSRRDPAPLIYSEALALGIRVVVSTAIAYSHHAATTTGAAVARSGDGAAFLQAAAEVRVGNRPTAVAAKEVGADHWADCVASALLTYSGRRATASDRGEGQ